MGASELPAVALWDDNIVQKQVKNSEIRVDFVKKFFGWTDNEESLAYERLGRHLPSLKAIAKDGRIGVGHTSMEARKKIAQLCINGEKCDVDLFSNRQNRKYGWFVKYLNAEAGVKCVMQKLIARAYRTGRKADQRDDNEHRAALLEHTAKASRKARKPRSATPKPARELSGESFGYKSSATNVTNTSGDESANTNRSNLSTVSRLRRIKLQHNEDDHRADSMTPLTNFDQECRNSLGRVGYQVLLVDTIDGEYVTLRSYDYSGIAQLVDRRLIEQLKAELPIQTAAASSAAGDIKLYYCNAANNHCFAKIETTSNFLFSAQAVALDDDSKVRRGFTTIPIYASHSLELLQSLPLDFRCMQHYSDETETSALKECWDEIRPGDEAVLKHPPDQAVRRKAFVWSLPKATPEASSLQSSPPTSALTVLPGVVNNELTHGVSHDGPTAKRRANFTDSPGLSPTLNRKSLLQGSSLPTSDASQPRKRRRTSVDAEHILTKEVPFTDAPSLPLNTNRNTSRDATPGALDNNQHNHRQDVFSDSEGVQPRSSRNNSLLGDRSPTDQELSDIDPSAFDDFIHPEVYASGAKEPSHEEPSHEEPSREEPSREEPSRKQANDEEPNRDQASCEEPSRNQANDEEPNRDQASRKEPSCGTSCDVTRHGTSTSHSADRINHEGNICRNAAADEDAYTDDEESEADGTDDPDYDPDDTASNINDEDHGITEDVANPRDEQIHTHKSSPGATPPKQTKTTELSSQTNAAAAFTPTASVAEAADDEITKTGPVSGSDVILSAAFPYMVKPRVPTRFVPQHETPRDLTIPLDRKYPVKHVGWLSTREPDGETPELHHFTDRDWQQYCKFFGFDPKEDDPKAGVYFPGWKKVAYLRAYQWFTTAWATAKLLNDDEFVVIGHAMGLGKTAMCLATALILHRMHHKLTIDGATNASGAAHSNNNIHNPATLVEAPVFRTGAMLFLAPMSLLKNWIAECRKFIDNSENGRGSVPPIKLVLVRKRPTRAEMEADFPTVYMVDSLVEAHNLPTQAQWQAAGLEGDVPTKITVADLLKIGATTGGHAWQNLWWVFTTATTLNTGARIDLDWDEVAHLGYKPLTLTHSTTPRLNAAFGYVFVDEFHRSRSHQLRTNHSIASLQGTAQYVFISGTPIDKLEHMCVPMVMAQHKSFHCRMKNKDKIYYIFGNWNTANKTVD